MIGIDVAYGSIRGKRKPWFSVVGVKDGKIVFSFERANLHKLLRLIKKEKPDILATDNIYELVPNRKRLKRFLGRLSPETKVLQVTGPFGGQVSLYKIAKKHGIPVGERASSLEEARVCALLAHKGIGTEVTLVKDTTKIIVSRARSIGPGGFSQSRYRRKIHNLIQQVTRDIKRNLDEKGIDYDLNIKTKDQGYSRSEFTAYATYPKVRKIVREVKGPDVKVTVKPAKITVEKRKKYSPLIVGIDPGTTTGLSILDLNGHLVSMKSMKNMSRSDIINFIEKFGTPAIVATDIHPPPKQIEKISAIFNAKLISHDQLSVQDKREIVNAYVMEEKIHPPSDSHQRDSLAAAVKAFNSYKNKFLQIDGKLEEIGFKGDVNKIKELTIKGYTLKDAVDMLKEKKEKTRKLSEKHPEKDDLEYLKNKIKKLEKKIEKLEEENKFLMEEREKLIHEKNELQAKLERIIKEEDMEIRKDSLLRSKEKMIEDLKAEIIKEKERSSRYAKELQTLKRIHSLEPSKKLKPVKILKTFTKGSIQKLKDQVGLSNDVVYIMDASGGGATTARTLAKGVKCIIAKKGMSHVAEEVFKEENIPIIDPDKVRLRHVDDFAVIDSELFRREIENWLREDKKRKDTESLDAIEDIIYEYKEKRARELLRPNENSSKL
ncbi:MAG: DUF460 domain-containing protein [Candidatus Hydrothermarchaeota archaeon]